MLTVMSQKNIWSNGQVIFLNVPFVLRPPDKIIPTKWKCF